MKLTAPAGMTGHVHTSSGGVYYIDENGECGPVHHHHLGDMLKLGFSRDGTVNDLPAPPAPSTLTQDFVAGDPVVE